MSYTPKSEEALAKEGLLAPGTYDFEVLETSDKPSKKGNEMITLKLRVFDTDGNSRHIFDYIAFGSAFGERKFRHAANACGLMEVYNSGKLVAGDFLNTMGRLELKQQDGTPDYPMPKNVVSDYIGRDEVEIARQQAKAKPITKPDLGDDIPF